MSIISVFWDVQVLSHGNTECITDSDMYKLNACRLYLRITLLSDMTDEDNKSIYPWILTGDKQATTMLTYPWQIKPPERCWKKWKIIIT